MADLHKRTKEIEEALRTKGESMGMLDQATAYEEQDAARRTLASGAAGGTICDRLRKFGVEQPSGRGRNGRITAGCHRLFLVTRWGSFAQETARSQCTPSTIVLGVHCDPGGASATVASA